MMENRLFLIDGHALIFRMYYAFLRHPMVNSKGEDMSIIFGFTKYLLELIEKEKPTHLAVAFDPPGGSFRNAIYPEYKANRSATPQLVIDALEPLTELCRKMQIPVLMMKGYEADDVIGSMAHQFGVDGTTVYMVTPDKDYGQLVGPYAFQYKPGKSGSDNELLGPQQICEKYGIADTSQVIDMLTICGDSADNVPGVKGVGEVGAAKLIAKYGSVDSIYEHLDELSARQQEQFREAQDHILMSKYLVTIKTDIELETSLNDMALSGGYGPEVAELFDKYEFPSLKRFLSPASVPEKKAKELEYASISPAELVGIARKTGNCAISLEVAGSSIFSAIDGVAVAVADADGSGLSVAYGSLEDFAQIVEDGGIAKYGYNLKFQMDVLANASVALRGYLMDVELMHYLLNPERPHALGVLAAHYLDVELDAAKAPASLFEDEEDAEGSRSRLEKQTAAILLLGGLIKKEMSGAGLTDLYDRIEEPLIPVLSKMECTGVKVDLAALSDFKEELKKEIAEKEAFVREITGEPNLNLSSPKQLGVVLFEKMQLSDKMKKSSKGSWSTDEETLLSLADKSPVIDGILEYRSAKKLLSTYIEPFPSYISEHTGRVHTTFNQALTSTGRLSSSNPNLQNIPIRSENGREIRRAFVAERPGDLIMSADYSQIELRIMAHLCGDEHLLQAFREGRDVHSATAAKIFSIPVEEVTPDQRRVAKTANFGIMYGISAFGLSQRLRISRSEAKKIIDDYFLSFPSIRDYIDRTVASARESGYVETLFGRRRYIPDINSKNATVRTLAERNAVNAPIQGTAADIMKLAMIEVSDEMSRLELKSKMVLQIHDELLFEVVPSECELLRDAASSKMENVIKLSIPLTVECNYGKNWLEAH